MTKPFRFGVQVVAGGVGARRGATRPASSKTSGTRRCSCPTTSARSSRRCPRSRWRPRTRRRCASASLVFDNDYKHPAILAKEAATIDLLSRRPARARHRRGLDEDRLRRARPAVRPARGARRPVRRGAARHQAVLHRRAVHVSRRALPHHRLRVVAEAGAEAAPADPRSAAAASACCRSRRARPTSSASTRTCAPARSALDAATRLAAGADRPQDPVGPRRGRCAASTTSRSRCASSSRASPTTA